MQSITTYTNISNFRTKANKYNLIIIELRRTRATRPLTNKEKNKLYSAEYRYNDALQQIEACKRDYAKYVEEEPKRIQEQMCRDLYREYTVHATMSDIIDAYNDYQLTLAY